jgi:hypothetical protein
MALARLMLDAPPDKVAPLLGIPADQLIQRLRSAGFDKAIGTSTLAEIAKASGQDERALITALVEAK